MKIFYLLKKIAIAAVIVLMTASCSKRNTGYTNAIPGDAKFVIAFDVKSIAIKGGFADVEVQNVLDSVVALVQDESSDPELGAFMRKIINNPMELGLSLGDKVYIFSDKEYDKPFMLCEIDNVEKLKNNFDMLSQKNICTPVTRNSGCYSTLIDDEMFCVFNETTFIMTDAHSWDRRKTKSLLTNMLRQDRSKSINMNPGFQKMVGEMHEVGSYIDMSVLSDFYTYRLNASLAQGFDPKGSSILLDLHFDKGVTTMKVEYFTSNPLNLAKLEQQSAMYQKPTNVFMKTFPYSTFACAGARMNGEEIYKVLSQTDEFVRIKNDIKDFDIERILKTFDGDISWAVTGFVGINQPGFTIYAEVKDDYLMKTFEAKRESMGMEGKLQKLEEGKYSLKQSPMTLYFGQEGKYIYFTSDRFVADNVAKTLERSLADNPIITKALDSYGYMVINVDEILKNPAVMMLVAMGDKKAGQIAKIASDFSYAEIVMLKQTTGELNVVMKDKETNTLKYITNMLSKYITTEFEKIKSFESHDYHYDMDVVEEVNEDYEE